MWKQNFEMDTSLVYKAANIIASMCLMISSCVLPAASRHLASQHDLDRLEADATSLRSLATVIYENYKSTRFANSERGCPPQSQIMGLPPYHQLTIDHETKDLIHTHHAFIEVYIELMERVIEDEEQYQQAGAATEDARNIQKMLKRVKGYLNQQLVNEDLLRDGIVLFNRPTDTLPWPQQNGEAGRNIRVLCALENIHRYLPTLERAVRRLKHIEPSESP